jgi:sugar lactone lactonase YvrE
MSQRMTLSTRAKGAMLALVSLFLVLGVAVAAASGEDAGEQPSLATGLEGLEGQANGAIVPAPTNPAGGLDVPLPEMGRVQAGDLLQTVFEPVLDAAGGTFDELDVQKFLAPDAAVVSTVDPEGNPQRVLVDSTIPLGAKTDSGDLKAIDLGLETGAGGVIEAVNPLVDIKVPAEIGAPITMPDAGIGIRLETDADSRQASVLEAETVFYPDVAADTDFAVTPTPLGLETLTQIRSADSPTTQRLALSVPNGAEVSSTDVGGAKVLMGDELLMTVDRPAAMDAAGEEVPVTMTVAGGDLVLTVSPEPNSSYPILVDPLFQTYEWAKEVVDPKGIYTGGNEITKWLAIFETKQHEEWSPEYASTEKLFYLAANNGGNYNNPLGLYAATTGGPGTVTAGSHVAWKYAVPRFYEDQEKTGTVPQTYISKMKLWNLTHMAYGKIASPYMELGLMRPNGTWASNLTHTSLSEHHLTDLNYKYEFNGDQESKFGSVGLWALENYTAPQVGATVFVQAAQVELSEPSGNIPKFGTPLAGPIGWLNSSPKPVEFVVSDDGLGVYAITATPELPVNPPSWNTQYGCTGVGTGVCPRTWASSAAGTPVVKYEPSAMPTGIGYLKLVAEDPLGQKSSVAKVQVKVDHTPPELGLSGQLTEQATLGTKLEKYALKASANDGDEVAASALTPVGAAGTGTGQLERPMGIAVDQEGNRWVADRVNNRIVEYDKAGAYIRQITGPVEAPIKAPNAITVNSALGVVLIVEGSEKRVRSFTTTGTLLGTITNAAFSEPFGVAWAPNGNAWVSDPGAKKLFLYSEGGSLKQTISIPQPQQQLAAPYGVETDEAGNAWVAVQGTDQILEYSQSGSQLFSFGGTGTGTGQFKAPADVAIAPSGNLIITDSLNNRIKVHKPDGTFLRQYGTSGSGNTQLKEPQGVAISPGNQIVVADAGNKRIARWEHADLHVESGVVKTEIKVDGVLKDTYSPGCAAGKNCSASREWTLDADDYAVGNHTVQVIATDGAGVQKEKTLTVETHGDLTVPTNVLSGTITEQATLGKSRPAYTAKLQATDPGPADQRHSGVASIEFKVDGVKVDSIAPGCPSEDCSLTREWTLNSNSFAPGWHWLEAISTDAAGKTKINSREFTIKRDETAPEFQNLATFYTAPSGWLEQNSYEPKVDVVDGNGYGVTKVELKIDGQVAQTTTATCPAGGCSKQFAYGKTVNMASYDGGAHPAELVATDGAGNVRKRTWTINVNPDGNIPAGEAVTTLEAFDDTSESTLIAPNSETIDPAEQAAGNDPVLHSGIGELHSTGTPNLSTISTNTESGFEVGIPDSTIEVEPVTTAVGASGAVVVEESSAVASNTATNVDTIIRPVFDGIMAFQSIRDQAAVEYFSWEVLLREGQTLNQVNEGSAEIRLSDGTPAMTIMAEPAHDAVGTSVPTSLAVSEGKVITLRVQHKSSSFVYPVTGGTGWKGGISTETVAAPMDQKEQQEARFKREEEERIRAEEAKAEEEKRLEEIRLGLNVPEYSHGYLTPPILLPYDNQDDGGASASKALPHYGHFYIYDHCTYDGPGGCKPYKLTAKTWIEYNRKFVWWKASGIHPACFKSTLGFTADNTFCNWVGQNHQPNYGGYHITSRHVWAIAPLGGPVEREEPVSIYAYPSGYANGHNTFCVCNPST